MSNEYNRLHRLLILQLLLLLHLQFVTVLSLYSETDPIYLPKITDWEPELKEIMAIEDPKERTRKLAKLGQKASKACAGTAKERINQNSTRKDNAELLIDAHTERTFNDYINQNWTNTLKKVNSTDQCDPNAAKVMEWWKFNLDYICKFHYYYVDLANEVWCNWY